MLGKNSMNGRFMYNKETQRERDKTVLFMSSL